MTDRLVFPTMDRGTVAARRSRAVPRAPLRVAQGQVGIGTMWDGADPLPAGALTAEIAWGSSRLKAVCAPDLVTRLVRTLDEDLELAAIEPDLLGILAEAALLPGVVAFESQSGQEARCLRVAAEAQVDEPHLPLVFEAGGRRWPVMLRGDAAALANALNAWPLQPQPWSNLPMPAVLRLGVTRLSLSVVRSLGVADTVLFESRPPGAGALVLAEAWVATAQAEGTAWRLDEAPRPARGSEKEWVMRREDELPAADDEPGDLDDIPVQLAFDLGRIEMPLGAVRRLGAGAVIETGRHVDDLVRISANGRLVGHGTLVDIEGQVGVEIVRLFDNG